MTTYVWAISGYAHVYDSYVLLFYRWDWRLDCLAAAFTRGKQHFCLVRYLEPVLSGTEPVLNEWGCPLLTLTNVIRCTASTLVSCAVSVVHQCDSQCVLAEQETTSRIERQLVTQKKTVFYITQTTICTVITYSVCIVCHKNYMFEFIVYQ